MFSAQANPWEHCVASGQAGGRGRRSGRVSRQKRRRRQEKAAAAGARALPRRNPPQPRYRNTCTGTHPPTLSPSKGELDRALTPRIARAANRAIRGPGASGAPAMYAMHRRSMRTSNSDIHCSPRPLALHARSAHAPLTRFHCQFVAV
jgi:hypothetical protein